MPPGARPWLGGGITEAAIPFPTTAAGGVDIRDTDRERVITGSVRRSINDR
jgi:hypothetical protein